MQVETAEDGAIALDLLKQRQSGDDGPPFDICLCDMAMPVMSGPVMVRLFRAWERLHSTNHLPIFALTSNSYEEHIRECTRSGMGARPPLPAAPGSGRLSTPVRAAAGRQTRSSSSRCASATSSSCTAPTAPTWTARTTPRPARGCEREVRRRGTSPAKRANAVAIAKAQCNDTTIPTVQ